MWVGRICPKRIVFCTCFPGVRQLCSRRCGMFRSLIIRREIVTFHAHITVWTKDLPYLIAKLPTKTICFNKLFRILNQLINAGLGMYTCKWWKPSVMAKDISDHFTAEFAGKVTGTYHIPNWCVILHLQHDAARDTWFRTWHAFYTGVGWVWPGGEGGDVGWEIPLYIIIYFAAFCLKEPNCQFPIVLVSEVRGVVCTNYPGNSAHWRLEMPM